MTETLFVAYLDAGSASLILGAIASGGAGLWMFVKAKWAKIRRSDQGAEVASATQTSADGSD